MKITDMKVFPVAGKFYNWTVVKITTDEGIVGFGESTNWIGSWMVVHAVEEMRPYLIGQDPMKIDSIWLQLYKNFSYLGIAGVVISALSGVDIALWDIKGKKLGAPIYELLGGKYRDTIPLYANGWFLGKELTPDSYAKEAQKVVAKGFTAMKCDPFRMKYLGGVHDPANLGVSREEEENGIAVMHAIRETVGPKVEIAVDAHGRFSVATAIRLGRLLEPFDLMWFEEPVPPENMDALSMVREKINVPICVGERLCTRHGFRQVLERKLADHIMPDVTRTGGISELRKIAAMAEPYYIPVSPHNPNGPLSTLASLQVLAATPNIHRLELWIDDVPWLNELMSEPFKIENGSMVVPNKPGLGAEFNEKVLLAHPARTEQAPGIYI